MESYSIYDQFVTPLKGVLTRSANNDGKMTLTIPNENGPGELFTTFILSIALTPIYSDSYVIFYTRHSSIGFKTALRYLIVCTSLFFKEWE